MQFVVRHILRALALHVHAQEETNLWGAVGWGPMGDELAVLLSKGWEPAEVERRSVELAAGMQLIKAWGAAVPTAHEDGYPVPDVETDIVFGHDMPGVGAVARL